MKIALRFWYAGSHYNGLAFQNNKTPLPTVEGTLYKALADCRLIDPIAGASACAWERCGRTDRGVSSAAQVVSLWVRCSSSSNTEQRPLRYMALLNRLLPASMRIYAWSPVAPTFSARFNCLHRHYKYFFNININNQQLDIAAMRNAAQRLVGEHDFRNLCKVDPSKQITHYRRCILKADISAVGSDDNMYVLDLIGTAFLYHQVRHIVAVLLLVGARLESPSVITALLNADPARPEPPFAQGEEEPELVTCKPQYTMADALPLVLWDCVYSHDDVAWQTDDGPMAPEEQQQQGDRMRETETRLYDEMSTMYTRSLIHTTLDAHFLRAVAPFHPPLAPLSSSSDLTPSHRLAIPIGGGLTQRIAPQSYTPLLRRKRLEHVDVVNGRWRKAEEARREARKKAEAEAEAETGAGVENEGTGDE